MYSERRIDPRLKDNLPLSIKASGCDIVTQTKDISCSGAYCSIDKFIKPMTRLDIKMQLPLNLRDRNRALKIHCQGTVVRVEAANPGGFNIAIFFNRIKDGDKRRIAEYVNQHIKI